MHDPICLRTSVIIKERNDHKRSPSILWTPEQIKSLDTFCNFSLSTTALSTYDNSHFYFYSSTSSTPTTIGFRQLQRIGRYGTVGPPTPPSQVILGIPIWELKNPSGSCSIHSHNGWERLLLVLRRLCAHRPEVLPLISWGMLLTCWQFGGAAAASTREPCSLWTPSIAYLLGGLSASIIDFVLWNRLRGETNEWHGKSSVTGPPTLYTNAYSGAAGMYLLNASSYYSSCHITYDS